jgi:hypothetical protein
MLPSEGEKKIGEIELGANIYLCAPSLESPDAVFLGEGSSEGALPQNTGDTPILISGISA